MSAGNVTTLIAGLPCFASTLFWASRNSLFVVPTSTETVFPERSASVLIPFGLPFLTIRDWPTEM